MCVNIRQKTWFELWLCIRVMTDTFGSLDPDSDPKNGKSEYSFSLGQEVFYEVRRGNTVLF